MTLRYGRNFAAARGLRHRPRAAEHLVMMFPLWHGTMPALRKTFIDQVMRGCRPRIPHARFSARRWALRAARRADGDGTGTPSGLGSSLALEGRPKAPPASQIEPRPQSAF